MSTRTEIDRLIAARPAAVGRTEDVVDAAAEDRILQQILTSGEGPAARAGSLPPARPRRLTRRLAGAVPRAAALGLVAAVAVAAVILAVTTLLPASRQASPHPHVQLAAWTVVKLPNGDIRVRIRQLRHPAALQRKLRAEGVPASVFSIGQHNPCRTYPASTALLSKVFPNSPPPDVIVIRPSALPRHAGVQLAARFGHRSGEIAAPIVVYATPRCSGS